MDKVQKPCNSEDKLRSSLMKGWKEIRSRLHSVSTAFHVNMAEAALAKQADL
jgi:hypothetical protein